MPDIHMEELDNSECRRLLAERHLGRLAIPDFGGPVIFPVNYVFDQDLVIFRTDPGSKLDAPPTSLNTNPRGWCTNEPGAGPRTGPGRDHWSW